MEPLGSLGLFSSASLLSRSMAGGGGVSLRAMPGLQRSFGNRYVQAMLSGAAAGQPAGEISSQIQDQVEADAQGAPAGGQGADLNEDVSHEIENQVSQGGAPLPEETQDRLKDNLGLQNPENIQVHTGPEATRLSDTLGAQAFTTGEHIFFNDGEYDPGTNQGRKLLYHESWHTLQQGGESGNPGQARLMVNPPGDRFEQEAEAAADQAEAAPGRVADPAKSQAKGAGEKLQRAKKDEEDGPEDGGPEDGPAEEPQEVSEEEAEEEAEEGSEGDTEEEKKEKQNAKKEGEDLVKKGQQGAKEESKEGEQAAKEQAAAAEKEAKKGDDIPKPPKEGPENPPVDYPKPDMAAAEATQFDPAALPDIDPTPDLLPGWNELATGTIQLTASPDEELRWREEQGATTFYVGEETQEEEKVPLKDQIGVSESFSSGFGDANGGAADRAAMAGEALGKGALAGLQAGATSFATNFLTGQLAGRIPGWTGLMSMAQIAYDPAAWFKSNVIGIGNAAMNVGSTFKGLLTGEEDTPWGYIARILEFVVSIIDFIGSILGLIGTILNIILSVCAIMIALAAIVPFCIMCWTPAIFGPIQAFITPISKLMDTLNHILQFTKLGIQPFIIIFRFLDLVTSQADPEKLAEKQAKLQSTMTAFTAKATELGLQTAQAKAQDAWSDHKQAVAEKQRQNDLDALKQQETGIPAAKTDSESQADFEARKQQAQADFDKAKADFEAKHKTEYDFEKKLSESSDPKAKQLDDRAAELKKQVENADSLDARKKAQEQLDSIDTRKSMEARSQKSTFEKWVLPNEVQDFKNIGQTLGDIKTGWEGLSLANMQAGLIAPGIGKSYESEHQKQEQAEFDKKREVAAENAQIQDVKDQQTNLQAERSKTETELADAKKDYDVAKSDRDSAQEYKDQKDTEVKTAQEQKKSADTAVNTANQQVTQATQAETAAQNRVDDANQKLQSASDETSKQSAQNELDQAKQDLNTATEKREQAAQKAEQARVEAQTREATLQAKKNDLKNAEMALDLSKSTFDDVSQFVDTKQQQMDRLDSDLQTTNDKLARSEKNLAQSQKDYESTKGINAITASNNPKKYLEDLTQEKNGFIFKNSMYATGPNPNEVLKTLITDMTGVDWDTWGTEYGWGADFTDDPDSIEERALEMLDRAADLEKRGKAHAPLANKLRNQAYKMLEQVNKMRAGEPSGEETTLKVKLKGLPDERDMQVNYEQANPDAATVTIETTGAQEKQTLNGLAGGELTIQRKKTYSIKGEDIRLIWKMDRNTTYVYTAGAPVMNTSDGLAAEIQYTRTRTEVSGGNGSSGGNGIQMAPDEAPPGARKAPPAPPALQAPPPPSTSRVAAGSGTTLAPQAAVKTGAGSKDQAALKSDVARLKKETAKLEAETARDEGTIPKTPSSGTQFTAKGTKPAPVEEKPPVAEPAPQEPEPPAYDPEAADLIRKERMAELLEILPPPPEGVSEEIEQNSAAYQQLDVEEYDLRLQSQEASGFQEDAEARQVEVKGMRALGQANQAAMGKHQQDADEKLKAQAQMKRTASGKEGESQESAKEGGGGSDLLMKILGPILQAFGMGGSRKETKDTATEKPDPSETKQGAGMIKSSTEANAGMIKETSALADKQTGETQAIKADTSAMQGEMQGTDDMLADKQAGNEEAIQELDSGQEEIGSKLEMIGSEKENLRSEQATNINVAQSWADAHYSIRESVMSQLEAELSVPPEQLTDKAEAL